MLRGGRENIQTKLDHCEKLYGKILRWITELPGFMSV